jgi:hypothetical protein
LSDVEVKETKGRKGPGLVVESVNTGGEGEDEGAG